MTLQVLKGTTCNLRLTSGPDRNIWNCRPINIANDITNEGNFIEMITDSPQSSKMLGMLRWRRSALLIGIRRQFTLNEYTVFIQSGLWRLAINHFDAIGQLQRFGNRTTGGLFNSLYALMQGKHSFVCRLTPSVAAWVNSWSIKADKSSLTNSQTA